MKKISKTIHKYKFKFDARAYPELFDVDQIDKIGWYGQNSKYCLDQLAKDHRISIDEAVKNGYDPYYISHPINCEIMSMRDNLKKGNKSSLTYRELVELVDEYDVDYCD